MAKKTPVLDEKGFRKFGIRDKLSYAAGDLGCNMSFGLKEIGRASCRERV